MSKPVRANSPQPSTSHQNDSPLPKRVQTNSPQSSTSCHEESPPPKRVRTNSPQLSTTRPCNTHRCRTALGGNAMELKLPASDLNMDMHLESLRQTIHTEILRSVERGHGVKWYLLIKVRFIRPRNWSGNKDLEQTAYFSSITFTTLPGTNIDNQITTAFAKIMQAFNKFMRDGSGWIFDNVLGGSLFKAVYRPLEASSYIPTPKKLASKKAIINVKNEDHKCFLWSVLAALNPVQNHTELLYNYKNFENELDCSGISFPMKIDQIKKFANQNQLSISVFGYDNEVFPLYICENGYPTQIDLLYITNDTGKEHYCLIKSMSRLLADLTKNDGKKIYC